MAIFTNQATLTYNNTVTNSNVATGEILEAVSVTKTAVTTSYAPESDVTYAVSIVGGDNASRTGITVTDDLGAYTVGTQSFRPLSYVDGSVRFFINGVLQPTPAVNTENGLVISGISLPAGGNALILYEAQVTEFADPSAAGSITNTVTVTGPDITGCASAQETIFARSGADLSITKTISPAIVTENSRVTYGFVIQNFGNGATTEEGAAVLTDTFLPILRDLTVSYNGTAWTEGVNYNYDPNTGLFQTLPGQINIPAGSFIQNPTTGVWVVTPGVATLTITGTI